MTPDLAPDSCSPPQRPILLVGGGGHATVVADVAASAGFEIIGFVDDAPPDRTLPLSRLGFRRLGSTSAWPAEAADADYFIAVGDNTARRKLAHHWEQLAASRPHHPRLVTLIHASAILSPHARLEPGVLVAPAAVINASARIHCTAIINTRAVIEHDCVIGAFAHIAPATALGGNVSVGELTLVGMGARILPGIAIGKNCTIAAAAVVTRDVPDHSSVRGIPARPVAT